MPAGVDYRYCLECGWSLQRTPPPPPPASRPAAPAAMLYESREVPESTESVTGRVVVTFAIVGGGLGLGTVIFLWVVGFFGAVDGVGDVAQIFAGGIALAGAISFALPIGVVLAAWGGTEIGRALRDGSGVFKAAAIACGLGHGVLLVVLGVILVIGVLIGSIGDGGAATPPGLTFEEEPSDIGGDLLTIAKLALSIVPAGLVGGLTAAMNTRR